MAPLGNSIGTTSLFTFLNFLPKFFENARYKYYFAQYYLSYLILFIINYMRALCVSICVVIVVVVVFLLCAIIIHDKPMSFINCTSQSYFILGFSRFLKNSRGMLETIFTLGKGRLQALMNVCFPCDFVTNH